MTKIWLAAALLVSTVAAPAFAADTTPATPAKPHMMHKTKMMPMKHGAGLKASHESTTDQLNQQELTKIKS